MRPPIHLLALVLSLVWACSPLLDAPGALYAADAGDGSATDGSLADRARLEGSTSEPPDAPDAEATTPEEAGATPNVDTCDGGECGDAAESPCPPFDDPCQIAREVPGGCEKTVLRDCTPCGDGGRCAVGVCTPGGILFRDGFEGAGLQAPWSNPSDRPWAFDGMVRYFGEQSALSGRPATNETSDLTLLLSELPAGSVLRFWFRTDIHKDLDAFTLSVLGEQVGSWAGDRPWEQAEVLIGSGSEVALVWSYARGSPGADGGGGQVWLDDVVVEMQCD